MSNNSSQLEFDFGSLETFKIETRAPKNLTDMVVESTSDECNAAITQTYVESETFEDTKEESVQEEYDPEQILERRQELLKNRKRFVQIVLDAIYDKYKTVINALILEQPKWQSLAETKFDRVKRLGTARFIKQIVRDDKKLKELLKIKVYIDGFKKEIKNLPYIKSFLARCRVGDDRLLGAQSLKGDENCEIVARHFQKIKDALEDYRDEVRKDFYIYKGKKTSYQVSVNGKKISLKNKLKKLNLRNEIVAASHSITDLESFRKWLKTNFSLEQVSIENSDENILFCVFVSSLRKIVGKKIPTTIDKIELYKSLFNGRFIPKTLRYSPFDIKALDATFIEYVDCLWKSYLSTPDFFTKYPSYYFWLKDVAEAQVLKKNNLGQVWGMIPGEFREQWSRIDLPFEDADKLHTAFKEVQKKWNGDEVLKKQFFAQYPIYYFWFKNAQEAEELKKNNLGTLWGMIPDEFREVWSMIDLPFEDADKLYKAFEEVRKSWDGNEEAKAQFFKDYPSYYFWLKAVAEEKGLKKRNLRSVWGMIPGEFREVWSVIALPFEDADKLYAEILESSKTWNNADSRAYLQHFAQTNLNLAFYWGLIPTSLRQKFNLEYYYPGRIDYNGIKVDSKQEFAVLRVFEEVLSYKPEVGVNFQVEVDSNRRNTFDFKIEYQEEDSHVTHFFEWHPVFVSFNGGRNDAETLDEYQDIAHLIDDDYLTYSEVITYAQEQVEKQYYNKRLALLTGNTAHDFSGDVRLTCATAGISTGGLKGNLETLHVFLKQAKPDFDLSLDQLTLMFKGFLMQALCYEVESVDVI